MKFTPLLLSLTIHLVLTFFFSASVYFVSHVFNIALDSWQCLAISMGIILFVLYPILFGYVRTPRKLVGSSTFYGNSVHPPKN